MQRQSQRRVLQAARMRCMPRKCPTGAATDFCADLSCKQLARQAPKVATCVRATLMHLLLLAGAKPLRGDVCEVDFPYSVAATSDGVGG